MSLENELDKKKAEQRVYISPKDVPENVRVKLLSYKFKTDQKGTEGCFVYLEDRRGQIIVQKYTPTAYEALKNAIKGAGGYDRLVNKECEWRLAMAGRMQNKRLFPLELEAKKAK